MSKQVRYFRPWHLTDGFLKLPDVLMGFSGISLNAKIVWSVLSRSSCGKTYCFPRIETIVEQIGIGRDAAMKAISDLCDEGFLTKHRRGRGQSNVYHFLEHPVFATMTADHPDEVPENPDDPEEDPELSDTYKKSTIPTSRSRQSRLQEVDNPDFKKSTIPTSSFSSRETLVDNSSSLPSSPSAPKRPEEEEIETALREFLPAAAIGKTAASRLLAMLKAEDQSVTASEVAELVRIKGRQSIEAKSPAKTPGLFLMSLPEIAGRLLPMIRNQRMAPAETSAEATLQSREERRAFWASHCQQREDADFWRANIYTDEEDRQWLSDLAYRLPEHRILPGKPQGIGVPEAPGPLGAAGRGRPMGHTQRRLESVLKHSRGKMV